MSISKEKKWFYLKIDKNLSLKVFFYNNGCDYFLSFTTIGVASNLG
jgi:hypothetical protein